MPIVLRHAQTGEIAACLLRNVYDFEYYGAKFWQDEDEAAQEKQQLLEAIGKPDPERWMPIKVDESRLKLFNVKLNNDPNRRLYMSDEGKLTVERR